MKKTLSMVLATLMLVMSVPMALGEATSFYNEASGITFNVPEGFVAEATSEEDGAAVIVMDENEPDLVYVYQIEYYDDLAGVHLQDLSEDQIQEIAELFASDVGDLEYQVTDVDDVHYLLLNNTDNTFGAVVSLLNGWACYLYAVVTEEDTEFTEAVWTDLEALQLGIEYEE